MSELAALLKQVLSHTRFRTRDGTVYSAEEWQDAIDRSRGRLHTAREVLSARPEVDEVWVGSVADHLRGRLASHIDVGTDRIGHSFPVSGESGGSVTITPDYAEETYSSSSLSGFATALIRAAAVLGSDRAAELVSLWASGEPRHYTICVVLAGVYIDKTIELDEGVRLHRLPVSSDLLPISMPEMRRDSVANLLGHAVLEVDASTHPALFVARQSADAHPPLCTSTAIAARLRID